GAAADGAQAGADRPARHAREWRGGRRDGVALPDARAGSPRALARVRAAVGGRPRGARPRPQRASIARGSRLFFCASPKALASAEGVVLRGRPRRSTLPGGTRRPPADRWGGWMATIGEDPRRLPPQSL